jgi:predicted dehydrogenase
MAMDTTRRFFIKTGVAAPILYKLAGPKPVLKAAGPNDTIGLGFIGVGIRGSEHVTTFSKIPGVRAIIAADCYDGHLAWAKEATEDKIETTKDYQAVLERKDVDAVVISTPDHWHTRMVLDSLAAGKHVFVEKPMTYTIAEGKQIIEAVKKSGKLLMVGSQAKTSTLIAKAREVAKSGVLGKLNMARLGDYRNSPEGAWVYPIPADASEKTIDWNRWQGPAPKRAFDPKIVFRWRCWWEYSGGVATDLWVHNLTTIHEILDIKAPPKSVVAQGGIFRFPDGRTCPDLLVGVMEYPDFILEITANLGSTRRATETMVAGSEASLSLTRKGVLVTFEPTPSPIAFYGLNGWPKALREQYLESMGVVGGRRPPTPPTKPPEEVPVEQGLSHNEWFIKALRENLPSPESAEEGHNAATAAHMGNLSYRKGKKIRYDAAAFKAVEV